MRSGGCNTRYFCILKFQCIEGSFHSLLTPSAVYFHSVLCICIRNLFTLVHICHPILPATELFRCNCCCCCINLLLLRMLNSPQHRISSNNMLNTNLIRDYDEIVVKNGKIAKPQCEARVSMRNCFISILVLFVFVFVLMFWNYVGIIRKYSDSSLNQVTHVCICAVMCECAHDCTAQTF